MADTRPSNRHSQHRLGQRPAFGRLRSPPQRADSDRRTHAKPVETGVPRSGPVETGVPSAAEPQTNPRTERFLAQSGRRCIVNQGPRAKGQGPRRAPSALGPFARKRRVVLKLDSSASIRRSTSRPVKTGASGNRQIRCACDRGGEAVSSRPFAAGSLPPRPAPHRPRKVPAPCSRSWTCPAAAATACCSAASASSCRRTRCCTCAGATAAARRRCCGRCAGCCSPMPASSAGAASPSRSSATTSTGSCSTSATSTASRRISRALRTCAWRRRWIRTR